MNQLPKISHKISIKDNLELLEKYVKSSNYLCIFLKNTIQLNKLDELKITEKSSIDLYGINECTVIISKRDTKAILDTHLIMYPQYVSLTKERAYNTNKIKNILQSFETYRYTMSNDKYTNDKVATQYFDIVKSTYKKSILDDLRNYCKKDDKCYRTMCCKGEQKYYTLMTKSFNPLSDLFFVFALKKSSESKFHRKCSNWSNKIVMFDMKKTDDYKLDIYRSSVNLSVEKNNKQVKVFNAAVRKYNNMTSSEKQSFTAKYEKIKTDFNKSKNEYSNKKDKYINFKLSLAKRRKNGTYIPDNWFDLNLKLISPTDTSNQNKRTTTKNQNCNINFFDFQNKKEISYKINFILKIIKYYRKKKTKRYLILSLTFLVHSNRILIDMKNRRIVRIEPHGFGTNTFYNVKQINCLIKSILVDKLPNFDYINSELQNNDIPQKYLNLFNRFSIQGALPLCQIYSAYLQLLSIHYSKYTIISLNEIVSKKNISHRIINFYKLFMEFLNIQLKVNGNKLIKSKKLSKSKLIHEWVQGKEPNNLNAHINRNCYNVNGEINKRLCYQDYGFVFKNRNIKLTRKKLKQHYGLLKKSKKCEY